MLFALALLATAATTTSGPAFAIHGWYAFIILTSVILGAIVGIYKIVWPILRRGVHVVDIWPRIEELATAAEELKKASLLASNVAVLQGLADIAPSLETIATMAPKLELISDQFRNNGGSSMRDAVDRIERTTSELKQSLEDHAAKDDRVQQQLAIGLAKLGGDPPVS